MVLHQGHIRLLERLGGSCDPPYCWATVAALSFGTVLLWRELKVTVIEVELSLLLLLEKY
jgi:hypothetical protein